MSATNTIKAVAFDAYGTLFDVYSVGALAEDLFPGHGAALASTWRDKQIEYTRLRTMCDRYVDFWQVTGDALRYACAFHKLVLSDAAFDALMDQYARLSAFEENQSALKRLSERDVPMGILSNGTPAMLESAVTSSGLGAFFDHLLSVNSIGKFKTAPEAYQLGPDAFGVPARNILFVSSNCWDACGATWFGYTTLWLNRYGLPLEELGVVPGRIGSNLTDVADFVDDLNGDA